ncbi:PREDICTED: protein preY, mitochondrial [Crocodylus porosus]|uniref:protein preY, mitochondrial n=1 Tax=Crocodylus porosus TaxID=8502 RepID=UPI00093BE04C|nr:PREDICTED: protein preY, mitochondrial [Crocodylus porosus]
MLGRATALRRGLQVAAGRTRGPDSGRGSAQPAGLDPALLGLLVCPLSKRPLRYEESSNELINEELGIAYPVVDGIPNMIPQAARKIEAEPPHPTGEESTQS